MILFFYGGTWRYGERLRAVELFSTCVISTLYHWCHERVVHKRRTDIPDPCPLDVQWRISKAEGAELLKLSVA